MVRIRRRLCGIKNYFSEKKKLYFSRSVLTPLKVSEIFTVHVLFGWFVKGAGLGDQQQNWKATLWPDARLRCSAVPLLYFFFHLWKFSNKKILINYFKTFHLMASVFMFFFFVDLQRVFSRDCHGLVVCRMDRALMIFLWNPLWISLCNLIVI